MTESAIIVAIGMVASSQARPDARIYAPMIAEQAEYQKIDALVVVAVIAHESRFDAQAIGKDGKDLGLMQLRRGGACLEGYARSPIKRVLRPEFNILVGVDCLRRMIDRCDGDLAKGLSKYNGRGCKRSVYSRTILRTANRLRHASLVGMEGADGRRATFPGDDSILARNLAQATLHNKAIGCAPTGM